MKPFDTYDPEEIRIIPSNPELLSVLKSLVESHKQLVQMLALASNPVFYVKAKD
jgi:hypothetical protein